MDVRHPEMTIQLTGGGRQRALHPGPRPPGPAPGGRSPRGAEIEQYAEEAMSGDYDHLLQTTMRWLEAQ